MGVMHPTRSQALVRATVVSLVAAAIAVAVVESRQATGPAPVPRAAPAASSRPDRAVPFAVGESLTYDVAWSNFLVAGTATVSVRERRTSGRSAAYYLVAEGQPIPLLARLYPVYYKADALLDTRTLAAWWASTFAREGQSESTKVTRFDAGRKTATYEVHPSTAAPRNLPVAANSVDALSAIFLARAMSLAAGRSFELSVVDSGELYRIRMSVSGPEAVESRMGPVQAWRLTPVFLDAAGKPGPTRNMTLWVSADERRLPIRLQAQVPVGTFDLVLRASSRGTGR
jgi:hypothetical protein